MIVCTQTLREIVTRRSLTSDHNDTLIESLLDQHRRDLGKHQSVDRQVICIYDIIIRSQQFFVSRVPSINEVEVVVLPESDLS